MPATNEMEVLNTGLCDVKLLWPRQFKDDRGWFAEVFNSNTFSVAGLPDAFVQDNQSFSRRGELRGLHYQLGQPQAKLVRVLSGHIWEVAVDLRRDSPDFGRWTGTPLTGEGLELLWIPEGFAHGFVVLSETANVLYKTTRYYDAEGERCIRWNDPTLAIDWPMGCGSEPKVSPKNGAGTWFQDAEWPP